MKYLLPVFICLLSFTSLLNAQTLDAYRQISDSFYYVEKYDSALHYAQKAEVIMKRDSGENSISYAFFVGQFYGMNYEKLGDMQKALYWYKESMRKFQALHDTLSIGYGETITNYSHLCVYLGAYSEALPYLIQAESILKPYAYQVSSYGGALNNLATAYSHQGLYSRAEGDYMDLLKLVKKQFKTDQNYYSAKVYASLADVYSKTGLWQNAEKNYIKACNIFKKVPNGRVDYYATYFSLGQFYTTRNRADLSTKIFHNILDSVNPAKDAVLYASALCGAGIARQKQHKWKEAEKYYLSTIKMMQADERKLLIFYNAACNLASLYTSENRFVKADSMYRTIFAEFTKSGDRDQHYYLQAFAGFCENLIRSERYEEASDSLQALTRNVFYIINRNFAGMPQSEMVGFAESLKRNFDLVYSLIASQKANNAEITKVGLYNLIQLKGMILYNQTQLFKQLRNTNDTAQANAYRNWLKTKQILYAEYSRSFKDRILNTDSLEESAEEYERKFSADEFFKTNNDYNRVTKDIQSRLSAGEAAIEFVRFNRILKNEEQVTYGAFVVQRKDEPKFVLLCTEKELKHFFEAKNGKTLNAGGQIKRLYQSDNLQLYSLIWAPLEQYLKKVSNIYYSPAGILNSVALNAVPAGKERLLMDKYNLFFISGIKNMISDKVKKNTLKPVAALIWGKMNYSEKVYANTVAIAKNKDIFIDKAMIPDDVSKGGVQAEWKPVAVEETDKLTTVFAGKNIRSKTFEGIDATEDNFKTFTNGAVGIVHISTHGFFVPAAVNDRKEASFQNPFTTHVNPLLRCGLIFSGANYVWSGKKPLAGKDDGILTGYEISQMDFSKAEMVVLSACETGLGDIDAGNEGVFGLQRAFKLAGANKLVMSLWKVPPKQTAELMLLFYKNYLNGEASSSALLHSQKELRKKYPPYYWAAFVVME